MKPDFEVEKVFHDEFQGQDGAGCDCNCSNSNFTHRDGHNAVEVNRGSCPEGHAAEGLHRAWWQS